MGMLVGGRQKGRAGGSHNGCLSINLSSLSYKWWVGGRGRACGDRRHPPHVPIWGSTSRPPSFKPCLSVLNQLQQPLASNSAEEGYHPLFRALKRLQGPALLTRGDMVLVPASPVCPSPSAVAAPAKLGAGSQLTRWMLGSGSGVTGEHWGSGSGAS